MPAGDVAELVGDHALDLVGGLRRIDQAGVNVDRLPAGDEGVDRRIVDQHDLDIAGLEAGSLDQRRSHVVEQRLGLGIAQDRLRRRGLRDHQREHRDQREESGEERHCPLLAVRGLNRQ